MEINYFWNKKGKFVKFMTAGNCEHPKMMRGDVLIVMLTILITFGSVFNLKYFADDILKEKVSYLPSSSTMFCNFLKVFWNQISLIVIIVHLIILFDSISRAFVSVRISLERKQVCTEP